MSQLFEDSDAEVDIKIDNEYAKNYDTWRKKEELNKLKTKYGEADLNLDDYDSSSSSEDDETAIELTEQVEKDFYKTLAQLKRKDPRIYDENVVFFQKSSDVDKKSQSQKNDNKKTMFIEDYNRKLLLEKGDIASDSDDDFNLKEETRKATYFEEVNQVKQNITTAGYEEDSDNDDFLKKRESDKQQKEKEEADYKLWLAGENKKIDKETEASLKSLKEYWNDPNLGDGEKYLRDYILNERYLEKENKNSVPSYDEIVQSDENLSEDEDIIEKQEEFEHKYNFRFEEPDQEFIKRYPRTMQNSLRKEDNRRKLKRVETKERKLKEKAEKMEEIKKLKELKRKEIEEKIEKLKKITDNKDMAFNNEDIDGDFDPEAHDKRMQALFNDDFYGGPEDEQKPKFDLDDEDFLDLETENFDNWTGNEDAQEAESSYEPHCEDDDFNMDADYDPQDSTRNELLKNTKKKRRGRHKSKFAQMLASDRPKFDPTDKKYEEYIDEYYKLDCEDIIDNIPCRFKYRKVPSNSFGLTIEEILYAKDRELNRWCSLKKAVQIRPDHVEKYDQIAFSKRGQNINLKKKLLPSLFTSEEEIEIQQDENQNQASTSEINKIKIENIEPENENSNLGTNDATSKTLNIPSVKKEKINWQESFEPEMNDPESKTNGANEHKKLKKKMKYREKIKNELIESTYVETKDVTSHKSNITSIKKENTLEESFEDVVNDLESNGNEVNMPIKKTKRKRKNNEKSEIKLTESTNVQTKDVSVDKSSIPSPKKIKLNSEEKVIKTDKVAVNDAGTEDSENKNQIKKRKKKKKNKTSSVEENTFDKNMPSSTNRDTLTKKIKKNKGNKKKRVVDIGLSDARLAAYGLNPKKFKNKILYGKKSQVDK